jgi:hypothetical protein
MRRDFSRALPLTIQDPCDTERAVFIDKKHVGLVRFAKLIGSGYGAAGKRYARRGNGPRSCPFAIADDPAHVERAVFVKKEHIRLVRSHDRALLLLA